MSTHSHQGVGITLAGTQTSGYYVSGQPYIVLSGATQLTAISNPANQTYGACSAVGGAMLNPIPEGGQPSNGGTQGLCNWYIGTDPIPDVNCYEESKDVSKSLPISVSPGDSLVVAVLRKDEPSNKVPIYKQVLFMFVSVAPPAGSFCPGLYGTDRSLAFNESDIQWDRLANYPRASLTQVPTRAYMEDSTRFPPLPFFMWGKSWQGAKILAQANTANENAGNTAQGSSERYVLASLWLNLDFTIAEKRRLTIQIIQNGIDLCSYHMNGGRLEAANTYYTGWKFPAFLAATLLQDESMLSIVREKYYFVEGTMTTWRVSQSDVGRLGDDGHAFQQSDVGTYWWGGNHRGFPSGDRAPSASVEHPYQWTYGAYVSGQLLGVRMMGEEPNWGWGIAFRYSEEYLSRTGIGTGFFSEVYNLVNPTLPAIETVTVPLPATPQALIQEASFSATLSNPWGHPMRYTTNGSTPTSGSTLYSAPFTVSSTTTVKAACFPTDGQDAGSLATIAYTVITNGTPAPPTNVTLSS